MQYKKGEYLNAMDPASAERNEQSVVTMEGEGCLITFKLIAGLLARRIVFLPKEGDSLLRGERVGLIKFGSRCDLVLPGDAHIRVERGQRVKGGAEHPGGRRGSFLRADAVEGSDGDAPVMERKRPRRRGMYVLPSLFTAGNIAAGYYAIMQSLQGSRLEPRHFDYAALAILFAIPFDSLDGRIARMTNTTSDFGKELDSLADVITFGVAPSILAFTWGFRTLPMAMDIALRHKLVELGAFVCFLFLLCGASRLARFNISHDPQPKNPGRPDRKYFVGMPIPAAAGVLASVVHLVNGTPVPYWWLGALWIAVVGLAGFLMVSTWRFWSGKEINLSGRHPFQLMVLLGVVIYAVVAFSEVLLFLCCFAYMFSGLAARAAYSAQRRRKGRMRDSGPLENIIHAPEEHSH